MIEDSIPNNTGLTPKEIEFIETKLIDNNVPDIDYLLELNNSDIVREIMALRDKFSWEELKKFSVVIEETLTEHELFDVIERDEDHASYFDNYLNVRIPAQIALLNDKKYGPIPDFYVLPSKTSESIKIADSLEECIIERQDKHYGHYMAFKLALIPANSLKSCLDFHRNKYFNEDINSYTDFLKLLFADFGNIIGKRAEFIGGYIKDLPMHAEPEVLNDDLDNETVESHNHRQQVMAVQYLFKALIKAKDEPEKTEIARFIRFLTNRKSSALIKNTDTYKYLIQPFVRTERKNIQNLQAIRPFFERLMLNEVVQKIDEDIKNIK